MGDWWGSLIKYRRVYIPVCFIVSIDTRERRWNIRICRQKYLTFSTLSTVPTSKPPTSRSPQDCLVPGSLRKEKSVHTIICFKRKRRAMYLVKVSSTTSRDISVFCKYISLFWFGIRVDIQLECEVLLRRRKVRRMREGLLRIPRVTRSDLKTPDWENWDFLIERDRSCLRLKMI